MAINKTNKRQIADKLLEEAEQLSLPELKYLTQHLLELQGKRQTPNPSKDEVQLLRRISVKWPPEKQIYFDNMVVKRRNGQITEEEHAELIRLTDEAEMLDAERLQALLSLAQLRRVSLDEVMQQLGIKPPPVI